MLKKLSLAAAVSAATLSGLAYAETVDTPAGKLDVTMTATLATDWINRGQALNGAPTIQGSFDIAHESGLYVGVWGGSMSDSEGGSEFDYYIGFGGDITEDISYDISAALYTYPGTYAGEANGRKLDAKSDIEYAASLTAYGATLGVKERTKMTDQLYVYLGYSLELPAGFGLSASIGYTDYEKEIKYERENYMDWNVGVSKTLGGVGLALTYSTTDIDEKTRIINGEETSLCGAHSCRNNVSFSISKTF